MKTDKREAKEIDRTIRRDTEHHRMEKLPRWAQARIENLESDRRDLLAQVEKLMGRGKSEGSRVSIANYRYDANFPVADGARVLFDLTPRGKEPQRKRIVEAVFREEHGKTRLEVRALDMGLAVLPSASNTIYIEAEPW